MASSKKKKKATAKGAKKRNITKIFTQGRLVSLNSLRRHAWIILIAMVIVIGLMGQRYANQTRQREIVKLQRELAREQSEERIQKAEYMSLIREREMLRLLHAKQLNLDFQEKPPYVINPE